MNGIHDLGGMDGFGRVPYTPTEPVFPARWHGRVFAMTGLALAGGVANGDAFRHAIERLEPLTYLGAGYYGRWLAALERLLVDAGMLEPGAVTARVRGAPSASRPLPTLSARNRVALRTSDAPPRFAVGQRVRARNLHPTGHTRLPRYVRGRRGEIERIHPAFVFPDTNAHGRGEHPQPVYAVGFIARELWGDDADPAYRVHVDLFESYLEPA